MDTNMLTTEKFKEQIYNQAKQATDEVIKASKLNAGDILVVGCSSSEIIGETIGQASSIDAAQAVFAGIYDALKANGIYLAAQCCEHLNRAIIIERELALRDRMEVVNVVPQPKAGGSFATTAYKTFANPVAVEHIKADAGMDIGDTLIGMHLKDVAVPLRISTDKIGEAHLVCARTRVKFIGGERAVYDERLI
ncbi:MAG: TIGR01440 family protein [Lachnospiraceae bacterium]|nr:TIGR01440 family protein [Lachnospiraceae bacterium]